MAIMVFFFFFFFVAQYLPDAAIVFFQACAQLLFWRRAAVSCLFFTISVSVLEIKFFYRREGWGLSLGCSTVFS